MNNQCKLTKVSQAPIAAFKLIPGDGGRASRPRHATPTAEAKRAAMAAEIARLEEENAKLEWQLRLTLAIGSRLARVAQGIRFAKPKPAFK